LFERYCLRLSRPSRSATAYSGRVVSARPGVGAYTLIAMTSVLLLSSPLIGYGVVYVRFASTLLLLATSVLLAFSLAVTSTAKSLAVELKRGGFIEVVEGSKTLIEIVLLPTGIGKFFSLERASLQSDVGLRLSGLKRYGELIELELEGYPGVHRVSGIAVELADLFRIFKTYIDIAFDRPVEVRVIPKRSWRRFNVSLVVPYMILFEGRALRRRGVGSEVIGVREFTPHDEYKRIHWKATARAGKPMVKEYEHRVYRDTVVVVAIHSKFFFGDPPPSLILFRLVLDMVESLASMGMRVSVGIATESDIKIVRGIDTSGVHRVYRALSEVAWPAEASLFRYTSANRIFRWFSYTIVNEVCREPCLTMFVVDPLDDADIDCILEVSRLLKARGHIVKVLLAIPSTLRFLFSQEIRVEDIASVEGEILRVRRIASALRHEDFYLPTAYLRT